MVKFITSEELLSRYAAGERDFSGVSFIKDDELFVGQGVNLVGADLRNINLRGASFTVRDRLKAALSAPCSGRTEQPFGAIVARIASAIGAPGAAVRTRPGAITGDALPARLLVVEPESDLELE